MTQHARLLRLWAEGLPASVIAERLGLSVSNVYTKMATLRRAGHPLSLRRKEKKG